MTSGAESRSPLDLLGALAVEEVDLTPSTRHLEIYTMEGLLGLMWHGARHATDVAVLLGGGMGGFLGPAGGLYHELGDGLAAAGMGVLRVDYRRPSRLESSLLDTVAAVDLAARSGAERFVFVGHSFGGAVAIQSALAVAGLTAGVVCLSTQSAGCEDAGRLDVPLLFLHGGSDRILGAENSHMVRAIAGRGEVEVLAGADHLLLEARQHVHERLAGWIPAQLDAHRARAGATTTQE
ncbi:MAG: dienelactone hydrolase family protein [Acidimicrobiia bacterium]|nr:dienelactone hydrolase family protein [Acidimicrobiia bacterium]